MAVIPFKYNNFLDEAGELVTTQFEDKDVFNRYLRMLTYGTQEILSVIRDLMQKRSIDTAKGKQLDIIGNIVGMPRTLTQADVFPFFGFFGHVSAESFGSVFRPTVGGYWYSYGDKIGGDVTLTDDMYRKMIKAKIIKNNATGTNEDLIRFSNFVLDAKVEFEIDSNGKVKMLLSRRITMFEKALLGYVFQGLDYNQTYSPKALGVSIEVSDFGETGTLGFLGTPGAKGMVSLSYPFNGGIFADAYF